MVKKRRTPYIKKPEIFTVRAEDLISGSVKLVEKVLEIKAAKGELRLINAAKFFENNKENAHFFKEALDLSVLHNIDISSDLPKVYQDGPVGSMDLIKDKKALTERLTYYKKSNN